MIPIIPKEPAITKVEYWIRPYKTKAYFKFFRNSQRASIILRVTAEDGTVGWDRRCLSRRGAMRALKRPR